MGKHTPAPWIADGLSVHTGYGTAPMIARCIKDSEGRDGLPRSVVEANARLIAAAPDLATALQRFLRLYERELYHLIPTTEAKKTLDAAHAALGKAGIE